MAELLIMPGSIPPMPAVVRILSRFDREQLHGFIAVAIDLADAMDGEPDAEPATWPEAIEAREHDTGMPEDSEAGGDEQDTAYIEWHAKPGNRRKAHAETIAGEEDDETVSAEDDFDPNGGSFSLGRGWPAGAGCPISDSDTAIDDRPCDEPYMDLEPGEDAEREQMANDVPMLPVVSYEHNVFNDQRVSLGISNLQSSFCTNGHDVRSADTGSLHNLQGWSRAPGAPV